MNKSLSKLSYRRFIIVGLIYAVAACAIAATRPSAPATGPATTRAAAIPAFAAMAYYDTSCSRCHGPQGSFYGPGLGKGLSDAELIKVVREMAEGPAAAPLKEDELAVETAFHRALVAGEPFLSVTEIAPGKIAGEVMPEATLTLQIGTAPAKAVTVEGAAWSAALPADARLQEITLTAELKGKKTVLSLGKAMFSHREPVRAGG